MPTYTVHAPPPKAGEVESAPERFLFVRDGFYFWAFLLAPLWLLAKRLWLVLLGYVVVSIVFGGIIYALHAPWLAKTSGSLLVALLVGFEAGTLWRWTLARRGWRTLGFVVADDREAAERRFFAEWTKRARETPTSPPPQPEFAIPLRRGPQSGADVIGLFPEPER